MLRSRPYHGLCDKLNHRIREGSWPLIPDVLLYALLGRDAGATGKNSLILARQSLIFVA